MAEKDAGRDASPKPKPTLVRLPQQNGRAAGGPAISRSSFKAPRDLSLGSPKVTEKKKFIPNLNVARTVKKEVDESQAGGKKEHGRRAGKKQEKKEKKERPGLIQTMGSIFSEGVGGPGGIRRRGAGGHSSRESSSESGLSRPKLELGGKYDKDEEEARLKELLRDDFIDDLSTGGFVPVQLPMVDTGKIFKEEVKRELGEDSIKPSNLRRRPATDLDSDDDEDDPKPDVKPDVKPGVGPPPVAPEVSIADLVKAQKGDLLFIQLPDNLPVQAPKREGGGGGGCDLGSLDEGCLGKLQIRKSGACQLILGDNQVMDVEVGTRVGFLQDAVSLSMPSPGQEVGDLTVLGHVRHRLVVTPNWESLLERDGRQPALT